VLSFRLRHSTMGWIFETIASVFGI
jgi:hypothetical protein